MSEATNFLFKRQLLTQNQGYRTKISPNQPLFIRKWGRNNRSERKVLNIKHFSFSQVFQFEGYLHQIFIKIWAKLLQLFRKSFYENILLHLALLYINMLEFSNMCQEKCLILSTFLNFLGEIGFATYFLNLFSPYSPLKAQSFNQSYSLTEYHWHLS